MRFVYRPTPLSIGLMAALLSTAAMAEVPQVATDIAPVHSLVAQVMGDLGEPALIVRPGASPHGYSMRPSEAAALEGADLVVWIGEGLTPWLEGPVETLGEGAAVLELMSVEGTILHDYREGASFGAHDHGDHEGHDHEEAEKAEAHDHKHDHDHDHEKAETHAGDHAGHDHSGSDAHVWLDPANGRVWLGAIAAELSKLDPDNAATYAANAAQGQAALEALEAELAAELEPMAEIGFVVFHDAYQYFEKRFGLTASGSMTVSPEVMSGAERITEIRARVQELGAACVFAEPQFEPKLISTVIEGTEARSGVIDPLGAELENGPDLYFQVIRNMASSIKTCLSEAS